MAKGDEKFTGVSSINDYLLLSNVENNLKTFLDWGFLNIGGFINVGSTANTYNNNPNRLAFVQDPNYSDGQVWQTKHHDWVYDNVTFGTSSPTVPSVVNVNGAPATGYTLDFVNSRVIFNTAISTSSDVTMNYSYRSIQIHKASSNLVWWKQFQNDVVNDTTQFNQNTGEYARFAQNRVQLPCIIIEPVAQGTSEPYRLGDKSLVVDQDIILNIITNSPAQRNSIVDIIRLQEDKVIWLYDTNKLVTEGVLPFNFDGSLNGSRKPYNLIVNDCTDPDPSTGEVVCEDKYRWKTCRLKDFVVSEVESAYFFEEAKVRITTEIIFDDIS